MEKVGRTTYYLVKWKGYSVEENTWEPKSHLSHAKEALKEFHQSRQEA